MGYFRENIGTIKGYEPGFQPKQADIVKLNTNENPYPPSPKVMEVLREIKPEQIRRYPDPLGTAFREAAAEVNGVRPENIMCCNGGVSGPGRAWRLYEPAAGGLRVAWSGQVQQVRTALREQLERLGSQGRPPPDEAKKGDPIRVVSLVLAYVMQNADPDGLSTVSAGGTCGDQCRGGVVDQAIQPAR